MKIKKLFLLSPILLLALLYFYSPYFMVEVKNPLIELVRKKNIPKNIALQPIQQKVSIQHDGLTLSGVLTKSNTDTTKATIILIHGIRGNKGWWQTKSLVLADSSYQTLAIDLRAHGESEGRFTTFGVKEKEDTKAWVTWLEQNILEEERPIGIWGQSLGGAIALQSLATDDRLKFGVIESTFSNFTTVVSDYGKDYTGFSMPWLTNSIIHKAEKLADFSAAEANPVDACKQIQQPILFIHGSEDDKIDIAYNRENFTAIPHSNKEFYEIKQAGHYNVWNVGDKAYRDKIFGFIHDASTKREEQE